MKCIKTVDYEWHPMMEEMPPVTTDVELKKHDETVVKGTIVVEMSGFFIYGGCDLAWGSLSDYSHWRFIKNKKYPYYEIH